MGSDMTKSTPGRKKSYAVPAVGSFLTAACFFVAAALHRAMAGWYFLIAAINLANGFLMLRRARSAAVPDTPAVDDRSGAGDRH
jgi:hypothetical protein